jgi:hypothetical protein
MDETTPPKARLRGSLFVLPIFAAVGSLWFFFFKDCFFSVPIYDSLFWAIPCLLFLSSTPWFILIFRKLRRQKYVIANKWTRQSKGSPPTFFRPVCLFDRWVRAAPFHRSGSVRRRLCLFHQHRYISRFH